MKVDTTVLAVLSRSHCAGLYLTLPEQLDRKLYEATNKVLEAAGGKWSRKAKAHAFDGPADDAMEQIILTGQVTIPQDFGYFPTPPAVADRVMELARIEPGMKALEPSAGRGNLVDPMERAGARVTAYELLEANVTALREQGAAYIVMQGDFLQREPSATFDRVVMNPPFAKQADIHHVNHALKFLKPDGLLVSVMAAGVSFRDNRLTQEFRDLVRARGGEIEALPEAAFKASGTTVNTVVVSIPGEQA